VTASLAGCVSSRPPIQRWTRRHRLFVGTVDAAALAGETFGWAPPRRACRSPSAVADEHKTHPRRAPRRTPAGRRRRRPGTPASCPSVDHRVVHRVVPVGHHRLRPTGTAASCPSVDHRVVPVGRHRLRPTGTAASCPSVDHHVVPVGCHQLWLTSTHTRVVPLGGSRPASTTTGHARVVPLGRPPRRPRRPTLTGAGDRVTRPRRASRLAPSFESVTYCRAFFKEVGCAREVVGDRVS